MREKLRVSMEEKYLTDKEGSSYFANKFGKVLGDWVEASM
jgi:hypothetical protein